MPVSSLNFFGKARSLREENVHPQPPFDEKLVEGAGDLNGYDGGLLFREQTPAPKNNVGLFQRVFHPAQIQLGQPGGVGAAKRKHQHQRAHLAEILRFKGRIDVDAPAVQLVCNDTGNFLALP